MQPSSAGRITHCSLLSVCLSVRLTHERKPLKIPNLKLTFACDWLVWRWRHHGRVDDVVRGIETSRVDAVVRRECYLERVAIAHRPCQQRQTSTVSMTQTNKQTNKQKHSAQCDTQERNSVQNMLNVWRVNLSRQKAELGGGGVAMGWTELYMSTPLLFKGISSD